LVRFHLQGVVRPEGLLKFGLVGLIKSLREVPTFLLMHLAFSTGLCRFGMFRAVRAATPANSSCVEAVAYST
jgi:MPBQ/MSBQ methyltransferase